GKMADVADLVQVKQIIGGYLQRERTDPSPKLTVEIYDRKMDRVSSSWNFSVKEADSVNLYNQIVYTLATYLDLSLQNVVGTKSAEAHALYISAYTLGLENNTENNNRAIQQLRAALQIDPSFAEAHATLARLLVTRYDWNISNDRTLVDEAVTHAQRAK